MPNQHKSLNYVKDQNFCRNLSTMLELFLRALQTSPISKKKHVLKPENIIASILKIFSRFTVRKIVHRIIIQVFFYHKKSCFFLQKYAIVINENNEFRYFREEEQKKILFFLLCPLNSFVRNSSECFVKV